MARRTRRSVLVAEELLDLVGELVAGAHLERGTRRRLAIGRGVVHLLELPQHRDVLGVVGDRRVDALALRDDGRAKIGSSDLDAGHLGQPVEQSHRRRRIRQGADVVRYLHPDAECRDLAGMERMLEYGGHPGGYVDRTAGECHVREHLGRRRRTRQARRAGVRGSERVGPEGDHLRHTEFLADVADRSGEAMPGHVGFRAGEHEHVAPGRRSARTQLDRRPDEVGVDAVAEFHDRAPGPVVDDRVVVEPHERARLALACERVGGGGGGAGRVDPSGEHHDEDRFVNVRLVDQPLVGVIDAASVDVALVVIAHRSASRYRSALAAACSTWSLNGASSSGGRSPSAPPRYREYTPSMMHASFQNAKAM